MFYLQGTGKMWNKNGKILIVIKETRQDVQRGNSGEKMGISTEEKSETSRTKEKYRSYVWQQILIAAVTCTSSFMAHMQYQNLLVHYRVSKHAVSSQKPGLEVDLQLPLRVLPHLTQHTCSTLISLHDIMTGSRHRHPGGDSKQHQWCHNQELRMIRGEAKHGSLRLAVTQNVQAFNYLQL